MRAVHRGDRARSSAQRYALRCPAGCGAPVAEGAADAARMVREHPAACPDPGRAFRPVAQGPAVHLMVYADRIW